MMATKDKVTPAVALKRQQRINDALLIEELREQLPEGHQEIPGLIRAAELLRAEKIES